MTEINVTELEVSPAKESNTSEIAIETNINDELLDQIQVPSLASEERTINAASSNGSVSYTTVTPSELGAVPEEDEEAATSSTPSTVVSSCLQDHTKYNKYCLLILLIVRYSYRSVRRVQVSL